MGVLLGLALVAAGILVVVGVFGAMTATTAQSDDDFTGSNTNFGRSLRGDNDNFGKGL